MELFPPFWLVDPAFTTDPTASTPFEHQIEINALRFFLKYHLAYRHIFVCEHLFPSLLAMQLSWFRGLVAKVSCLAVWLGGWLAAARSATFCPPYDDGSKPVDPTGATVVQPPQFSLSHHKTSRSPSSLNFAIQTATDEFKIESTTVESTLLDISETPNHSLIDVAPWVTAVGRHPFLLKERVPAKRPDVQKREEIDSTERKHGLARRHVSFAEKDSFPFLPRVLAHARRAVVCRLLASTDCPPFVQMPEPFRSNVALSASLPDVGRLRHLIEDWLHSLPPNLHLGGRHRAIYAYNKSTETFALMSASSQLETELCIYKNLLLFLSDPVASAHLITILLRLDILEGCLCNKGKLPFQNWDKDRDASAACWRAQLLSHLVATIRLADASNQYDEMKPSGAKIGLVSGGDFSGVAIGS
ncbi:unnamed protein product [Protopolystoma xenopodis]|uniref:Uncharacterized protein n=1 Tax=Protopolystoma xenopodis TaxID=117903 RepID=A0A448XFI0_9PLAT|nr:unnamed protein product [Protopolystoma xenopodis]